MSLDQTSSLSSCRKAGRVNFTVPVPAKPPAAPEAGHLHSGEEWTSGEAQEGITDHMGGLSLRVSVTRTLAAVNSAFSQCGRVVFVPVATPVFRGQSGQRMVRVPATGTNLPGYQALGRQDTDAAWLRSPSGFNFAGLRVTHVECKATRMGSPPICRFESGPRTNLSGGGESRPVATCAGRRKAYRKVTATHSRPETQAGPAQSFPTGASDQAGWPSRFQSLSSPPAETASWELFD